MERTNRTMEPTNLFELNASIRTQRIYSNPTNLLEPNASIRIESTAIEYHQTHKRRERESGAVRAYGLISDNTKKILSYTMVYPIPYPRVACVPHNNCTVQFLPLPDRHNRPEITRKTTSNSPPPPPQPNTPLPPDRRQ